MVGDGDAVSVARQILQDLLRSAKRWFGVDHPFALHALVQAPQEVSVLGQGLQLTMEAELGLVKSLLEQADELSPKQPAQHFHRKEKVAAATNPARLVGRDSAPGDNAMKMRMMVKVLSPGVEHGQKTNAGAEVFWVGT